MTLHPLRDEHARRRPLVEGLLGVAAAVGAVSCQELRAKVREAHDRLTGDIRPQLDAEVRLLYPVVDELVGSDGATSTMRCEYVEIARLIDALGDLADRLDNAAIISLDLAASLRRVLYGLHALLCIQLAGEAHYLIPVLEMGLTRTESVQLLTAMRVDCEHGMAATA